MDQHIEKARGIFDFSTPSDFHIKALTACLEGEDAFISKRPGHDGSPAYELFPFSKESRLMEKGILKSGAFGGMSTFSCVLIISPPMNLMEEKVRYMYLTKMGRKALFLDTDKCTLKDVLNRGNYTYLFSNPETAVHKKRKFWHHASLRKRIQAVDDKSQCFANW